MSKLRELEDKIFEINAEPQKWLEVASNLENAALTLQKYNPCEAHDIEKRYQEYMLWGFLHRKSVQRNSYVL